MKWQNILFLLISIKTISAIFEPTLEITENEYYDNTNVSNIYEDIENYLEKWRISSKIPGIVAGISLKGSTKWTQAFGLTDLENNVTTHRDSVWRLASISKPITTTLVAKLVESGKINLENSVNEYLSTEIFPVKQWNGKNVTITVKQLLSHTAGLRVSKVPEDLEHIYEYTNVTQTLKIFKDDPLLFEPGKGYNYSNYGFQVVGAIIESVMSETFETAINRILAQQLGMTSTFVERHETIIPHRPRYYMKNTDLGYYVKNTDTYNRYLNETILNALIIDDLVSYQLWSPSGGLVSTVDDLLRFGNFMLSSYNSVDYGQTGLLKSSTVQMLWTPITNRGQPDSDTYYGMAWDITNPNKTSSECLECPIKSNKRIVWHTGGITGVSTFLGIAPEQELVIVLLTNLGSLVSIAQPIAYIASKFQ